MDNGDDFGLGMDFQLAAIGGALGELTDVGNEYGAVVDLVDLNAKSMILDLQDKLRDIVSKSQSSFVLEIADLANQVDPILARDPAGIPRFDVPGKFPAADNPGGFLPGGPVNPGVIRWNVWTRQSCVGDGVANIDCLPLPSTQEPPGDGWSVCYGGVSEQEARAACGRICPSGPWPDKTCAGPKVPPDNGDGKEPPSEPKPPTDSPKCGSCCCCPCSCDGGGTGSEPKSGYCLWRGTEPGQCEILADSQTDPPAPGWIKVTCSTDREYLERLKSLTCRATQEPSLPSQPGGPSYGADSLCDPNTWASDSAAQAVASLYSVLSAQSLTGKAIGDKAEGLGEFIFNALISLVTFSPGGSIAKNIIDGFVNFVTGVSSAAVSSTACNDPNLGLISGLTTLLSVFEKWIGRVPPRWSASLNYSENYLCPFVLPSAAEARQLYLTGVVPYDVALRLSRFNAVCDSTSDGLISAGQSRLTPDQAISAFRRQLWSADRAREEIRARGFLDPASLELQESLSRFLPGPSDLIRFVVRDAADPRTVSRFNLDAEFDKKYLDADPKIRAWAKAQGLDDDVVQFYWRAHWEIPSPTQLGEFWRRLRQPAPVNDAIAAEIGLTGSVPYWSPRADESLRVTVDDINDALAQQDILPFWRARFRETQYLPLTRVDVRRAYDLGIVGIDDVYESLVQDGYSNENAATLAKFAYVEKRKNLPNTLPIKQLSAGDISEAEAVDELIRDGYRPDDISKVVAKIKRRRTRESYALPEFVDFVEGSINREELIDELWSRNYSADQISEIVERGLRKVRTRFRSGCTLELETRFNWGEIDKLQAVEQLQRIGWNGESASAMVESWACKRAVGDRLSTVRQLLAWLELGLITIDDFRARAKRLMIPVDDQNRIIAQAIIRNEEQMNAVAEKERKRLEKDLAKQEQAKERARAKADRDSKAAAKAERDERERRQRAALMLEQAAIEWARFASTPLVVASDLLGTLHQEGVNGFGLTEAASAKAVVKSVELAIVEREQDLAGIFDLIAGDIQDNSQPG